MPDIGREISPAVGDRNKLRTFSAFDDLNEHLGVSQRSTITSPCRPPASSLGYHYHITLNPVLPS